MVAYKKFFLAYPTKFCSNQSNISLNAKSKYSNMNIHTEIFCIKNTTFSCYLFPLNSR